jgi:hypothetical protein
MPLPDSLTEALQGKDIVDEVLFNCERGQFEFSERVIVPAVYHIFLHPEDFERLEAVVPAIQQECKDALNKRLRRLNRNRIGRKRVEYGIQAQDWEIRVFANYQEDAEPGSVKVASSLAPAEEREFVGAVTVRVKRPQGMKAAASSAPSTTSPNLDTRETKKASETPTAAADTQSAWATLNYRDDDGEKTFALVSASTIVGRGSAADVVIRNAREEVSRRHCRIRREAEGNAFMSDLSSANGTWVDGVRLEPKSEVVFRDGAAISLANGAAMLRFARQKR